MSSLRLLRRTGVRPCAPRLQPMLEIEEVFRVDIIAASFEGRFPRLRVTFVITEPDIDDGFSVDYPLELPEDIFRDPPALVHPLRDVAQGWFDTIYDGVYKASHFVNDKVQIDGLWDVYGNHDAVVWSQVANPRAFWTPGSMKVANALLEDLDEIEKEISREIVEWVIDHHPTLAFVALSHYDDAVALTTLSSWLMSPATTICPRHLTGNNDMLTNYGLN